MAPLPPEPPLDDVAFALSAVQAGEAVMVDGIESLAIKDEVILTVVVNGTPSRSFRMTPEEALQVGAGLGQMAGKLINAEVDDNGRPTGVIHRLSRLKAGRLPTPPLRRDPSEAERTIPNEVSRVPFVAESDTDGDEDEPFTFSRGAFGGPKHRHNHFTRGLTYGCPACTDYMQSHGIPEESE